MLVLFLECLTTCGHDPRLGASIEAPFLPFVEAFEFECKCKIMDVPISFQEIDEDHAGECWNYVVLFESYSEIAIDRLWWDTARPDVKEQLIFHELGHCVLHRDHIDMEINQIPVSIMHPVVGLIPKTVYLEKRKDYVDELFLRGKFYKEDRRKSRPKN